MILHSSILTLADLHEAARGLPITVEATQHGSRDYARSFKVYLSGDGRPRNSGRFGADHRQSASWDLHGAWMARVYDRDPAARFGSKGYPVYLSREHFTWSTGNRFDGGRVPEDTHAAHRWDSWPTATGAYWVASCKGRKGHPCSAIMRRADLDTWREVINA